jgi:hypothetical protein
MDGGLRPHGGDNIVAAARLYGGSLESVTRRRIGQRVRSFTRASMPDEEATIHSPDIPPHIAAGLDYCIVINDELDEAHAAAFAGMKVEPGEGTTALHLTLLSVHVIEAPETTTTRI